MGLTSPNKHIKIHLNMEQFSLKTNWKLAEGLLCMQENKKDAHVLRERGKKSDEDGMYVPGRELRKRENMWVDTCPGK